MQLRDIWLWVLRLFGKQPVDKRAEHESAEHVRRYEDTQRISFAAIFANALANKAVSDSDITITDANGGESRRAAWIGEGLRPIWRHSKQLVAQALGKGGKVLLPCVIDGRAHVDIIDQSRMTVSAAQGDRIVSASVLAEVARVNGQLFYRWQDYTLAEGTHSIITRVTNDSGANVPFETVREWAGITPEITISGVDRILFGFLRCPTDGRKDRSIYGVPITYGNEDVIKQLHTCMEQMEQEYALKRAFVGADSRMFGKDNRLPASGLFKKLDAQTGLNGQAFWEVFDPAIRDSAYINRYNYLCEQLEKSIGTSRGILTEPQTANATATEIISANYDTFTMVAAIRENIETALNDTAYALDILAEAFGATPAGARGDWLISYDWDMSLLESSTETFAQLSELESRGLIAPERLVAWVTGLSEDEARDEIAGAKAARQEEAAAELGMMAYDRAAAGSPV